MAGLFHPVVEEWFERRFGTPTEPQRLGWPPIAAGRDTLIAAPTGSGKTLTAFLVAIDRLFRRAIAGELRDETRIIYISPLKALANDVHKNLEEPLDEICLRAAEQGFLMPAIRVAVRSGDTLPAERAAMLRRPPHILVTTPESLYILLTTERGRRMLRPARAVIVDEIHALAPNKRGAHLALSLERLDALAERPQRIGLSATVKPLDAVAAFLVGARALPEVVAVPDERRLDVAVEIPHSELGPVPTNEQWEERYQRLAALAGEHRSTLVFVSTRKLAERVAHRMREHLGEEQVAAHHGSLSRRIRLRAEERFKRGELRMMVATASLELGLDIGTVDLVCQIGSTRQMAAAWQRVGRAGHWRGATPKGRFFALTRDDLAECAALVHGIRGHLLDAIAIPDWPRDILAQQMVATVASLGMEGSAAWDEEALFQLARRAHPYRALPREEFDALVTLLSEGISGRRGRRGAFLHRDGVHHQLRPRRGARLAAVTCGGAIAENATYVVEAEPENLVIGTLDEDFAVESNAGDIILLGTHSWKVRRVETGRVRVEDAHGAPPTVPFWLGEAPGRTPELSGLVSEVRAAAALRPDAEAWLAAECGLDDAGARQLAAYARQSAAVLGRVPTSTHVVAERFFDEGGGMQLVIHAPFGSAINKAWGMALRKRFCRGFDFELQAAAGENGLVLSLSEQHSFPLETIFAYLAADGVQAILEQAILQAPIFQTRWRWTVSRSLALLRFVSGRKLPPQLQRMRSEDLLAAAFPMQVGCQDNHGGEDLEIPNHPYVQEAMRDCLREFLDLAGLQAVLRGLASGAIGYSAIDTAAPSGFAQETLNVGRFGFLDDAPLEERRSRTAGQSMGRAASAVPAGSPAGGLDAEAARAVCGEAWPQPQSGEELHDLLLSAIWLPESEAEAGWRGWLEQLRGAGRALAGTLRERRGWVAAERVPAARACGIELDAAAPGGQLAGAELAGAVWPGVEFAGARQGASSKEGDGRREAAFTRLIGGWMEIAGPVTAAALAGRLGLAAADVDQALLALEGQGRVLRGRFFPQEELAWCERGLLARIQRRTVNRLRAEIDPVSPARFFHFLLRWQHVERSARLHGVAGLHAALTQLQGFEAAASAWERRILPARVSDYSPEMLDQLCLSGEFGWARLSSPVAGTSGAAEAGEEIRRRSAPTRNSPLTFFRRADAAWLLPAAGWSADAARRRLSPAAAQLRAALEQRGASFFADLARGGGGLVKSEVEDGLWELVTAGLAAADGFDNLRAFLDPKRRAGEGRGHNARPRHSAGRWDLVRCDADEPALPAAADAAEAELRRAALAEKQARLWLARYGVIFKALLARESSALPWYEVLLACRRLEARGEIRGGRFVSGFAGEQYALPHAVESLRAARRLPDLIDVSSDAPPEALPRLSAADPLNLIGILLPGERIASQSAAPVDLAAALATPPAAG